MTRWADGWIIGGNPVKLPWGFILGMRPVPEPGGAPVDVRVYELENTGRIQTTVGSVRIDTNGIGFGKIEVDGVELACTRFILQCAVGNPTRLLAEVLALPKRNESSAAGDSHGSDADDTG